MKVKIFKTTEQISSYGLMDAKTEKAIFFSIMVRFITLKDAVQYAKKQGYTIDHRIIVGGKKVQFDPVQFLASKEEQKRILRDIDIAEHGVKKVSQKQGFNIHKLSLAPIKEES